MDDITFPTWVRTSPMVALASTLGHHFQLQYAALRVAGVAPPPPNALSSGMVYPSASAAFLGLNSPANDAAGGASGVPGSLGVFSPASPSGAAGGVNTVPGRVADTIDALVDDDHYGDTDSDSLSSDSDDVLAPPRLTTGQMATSRRLFGGATRAKVALTPRRISPGRAEALSPRAAALGVVGSGPGELLSPGEANGAAIISPTTAHRHLPTQTGAAMTDVLHDHRVQQLLRLSSLHAFASGASRQVSVKHAQAIVAVMALAVECRGLPSDVSKGLYAECSSLFSAFMDKLRGFHFNAGLDVEGFVASLIACGLKLRHTDDDADARLSASGGLRSPGNPRPLASSSVLPQRRPTGAGNQNVGLAGFDARLVDSVVIRYIPDNLDACAQDPLALGALEGLAFTYSRKPVYLNPNLVQHLHSLTDAFATSPHRRELAYKKLLSFLLEALSCSLDIDYERANNWITAIIQESYVVRGLFQRDILHARVVAATLTLLIRQYQEMADEYIAKSGGVDGMPDFTEGDELIELVWHALQDAMLTWEEVPTKPLTLYGANLRVVVDCLLRTEVERLRCYYVITSASAAYQQHLQQQWMQQPVSPVPKSPGGYDTTAASPPLSTPPTGFPSSAFFPPPAVGGADGGGDSGAIAPAVGAIDDGNDASAAATGAGGALATQPTQFVAYVPSEEEEVLRVRIITNIIRFLLVPTSIMRAIPVSTDGGRDLRSSMVQLSTQVLTIVTATEFTSVGRPSHSASSAMLASIMNATGSVDGDGGGAAPEAAGAASALDAAAEASPEVLLQLLLPRQQAQFSNSFYQRVEKALRELIQLVLEQKAGTVTQGNTAAKCLQSMCARNAHICSFAVSEVMDSVVRLSSKNESEGGNSTAESARRVSVCLGMLSGIVVPARYSLASPLSHTELARFGQLLCDTYEDSLRDWLRHDKPPNNLATTSNPQKPHGGGGLSKEGLPTMTMAVAAEAYWKLVLRVHDRMRTMTYDALHLTGHEDSHVKAQYLRALNGEAGGIRLLIRCALRCILNVAWPGSGILYQKAGGGERTIDGSTSPQAMAMTALDCVSPFLRPLCLLLHLATLFPIRKLRSLTSHNEYARYLAMDEFSDQYIFTYYFQPSKLRSGFYTEQCLAQLRTCWLMFTHYGFAREALTVATKRLAAKSEATITVSDTTDPMRTLIEKRMRWLRMWAASAPPLLRMRSSDMQQATADIAVLMRYVYPSISSSNEVRNALLGLLEDSFGGLNHWRKLTLSELFLVRSMSDLELLRASSGSIATLPLYLHFEVREFVASPAIPHVLRHITAAVSQRYLETLRVFIPTTTFELIDKDVHQLLLLRCFALASVREAAQSILDMLIRTFPSFTANCDGLALLWSLINLVERGSATEIEQFCRRAHFGDAPAIAADVNSDDRRALRNSLVKLAEFWSSKAQAHAPLALFEMATKFVVREQVTGRSTLHDTGARLAGLAAQPTNTALQPAALSHVLSVGTVSMPNYAQVLIRHSGAQGQVVSAVRIASITSVEQVILRQLQTAVQMAAAYSTVALYLQNSGNDRLSGVLVVRQAPVPPSAERPVATALGGGGSGGGGVPRQYVNEVDSLLGTSVALLSTGRTSPAVTVQLLRYVVQGPLRIFDRRCMEAAVASWRWLLAGRRERFKVALLLQLCEALEWTAARRLGIFDGARPLQREEVQTGDTTAAKSATAPYADDYASHSPHAILFAFLADNYVDPGAPIANEPAVLVALHRIATCLVQYPDRLSLKDTSFAETMRCAVLVGYIGRNLHSANVQRQRAGLQVVVPYTAVGVLRRRWYKSLLQWFRKTPPSWYFARDPTLARSELRVLDALIVLLKEERHTLSKMTLGFMDFSVGTKAAGGKEQQQPQQGVNTWGIPSAARIALQAARHSSDPDAALQKIINGQRSSLDRFMELLCVLLRHESIRLQVWLTPRRTLNIGDLVMDKETWQDLLETADAHDPAVVVAMASRFSSNPVVYQVASALVVRTPERYAHIPDALELYLTENVVRAGAPRLHLFTNCGIVQALRLLDAQYLSFPAIAVYAIRSLLSQPSEYLIFYLPQLLQSLASDRSGSIQSFLLRMSRKSTMFCHQLLWSLRTEGEGEKELGRRCRKLQETIVSSMTPEQHKFYDDEFGFTDLVTSLSGELMQFDKPQRKPKLRLRLQDAAFHESPATKHLYLPTDVGFRIVDVIPNTAGAMQSAAKCPILVQFRCVPREHEDAGSPEAITANGEDVPAPVVKACIFKMGDDCRQDQISLQLIGLMQRILNAVDVPSYLYPYRVVTTGQDSGIIECVPRSMSRNEIGKLVETNVAEFFVQTFGHPESVGFHRARDNFVKSMASYSVVSYILNIKDRHNGNIMIDSDGHVVHIDFGFLFDTSPGGDINFESSPFKLTTEMVQLIGLDVGSSSNLRSRSLAAALVDEDNYVYFKTLIIRCYLAVRQYAREICILVELMLHSGLPCFKPKKTIADLAMRLAVDRTEIEAADFMRSRIHEARQNYRTVLYDTYQRVAEGIEM